MKNKFLSNLQLSRRSLLYITKKYKNNKQSAHSTFLYDNVDDYTPDPTSDNLEHLESEQRILREAQEKEQMRKAHELLKKREEEMKKGNKEFLLKSQVPGVKDKPEVKTNVAGLTNGWFSVNGLWLPGSILLFPKRVYMWGVVDAHEIKEHTLDILKIIKPRPNYVIVGTGKYNVEFDQKFYDYFREYKILVNTMPTWEAICEFNNCNEDDMDVCAALIPHNL